MSQRASWDEAWKRYAAGVFHNWSKDARGLEVRSPKEGQAHRLRGQSGFWGFEKGKRKEEKGLVLGKTKSDEEVAVIRVAAVAERRTHPRSKKTPEG